MRNMVRSEDTEQMAVIQWAQYNAIHFPELKWLHHVPNGGSRNKLEAVKLKQMGVKAGVSDLCLPYPKGIYCGMYIEMKYGNNRRQETQKDFLADMAAAGHFVVTCYSAEDAIWVIMQYLTLKSAYTTEAAADKAQEYQSADEQAATQYGAGKQQSTDQTRQISATQTYENALRTVGYNIASGVAAGIRDRQSAVFNAAAQMAREAFTLAKRELGFQAAVMPIPNNSIIKNGEVKAGT